jgi:hypothetical protein
MAQHVITANLTREGVVVYLRLADGKRRWTGSLDEATPFATEADADRALAAAQADVDATLVVGIYRFEVDVADGKPVPSTARERIRAAHRPTIPYGNS